MDYVGQHGTEDAPLQQRLRDAAADKATDRFDFRDDHRRLDPFSLWRRCGGRARADQNMHPAPQIADRTLADPAAIDIEDELGATLHQYGAGIDRGERHYEPVLAILDEVIDDPALQLQGHDFEQKH